MISQGKINETIDLLNQKLPKFLTTKQKSKSFLYYQLFIECVKNNELFIAIDIAQNYFVDFQDACVGLHLISHFKRMYWACWLMNLLWIHRWLIC
jgi:hypothetical protein